MVTNAFPLCTDMNVATLKLKSHLLKGESLAFVGFYPTHFRPVSSAEQEKLCFPDWSE